jgi:hypothetical protein|tara:strand:+ start:469 stop:1179 length:711 start_codon:yes stop_codon:yes gene_type:complete
MYKTDVDHQLLRKNIKPWGQSQLNSWKLYELNKNKPGYKKHNNIWDSFKKYGLTLDRLTDWDIPPILGNGPTFGLQQQLSTSKPNINNVHEMNIYHESDMDKTNDYIVKTTQDTSLSRDVRSALYDFLKPLGWEKIRYSRYQQPSGAGVPAHIDVHRQLSNLHNSHDDPILCGEVRIGVVFLNDWVYGQGFGTGKDIVQGWQVGDFYEWPWFFPHHTFNNSNVERNSLLISGRKPY